MANGWIILDKPSGITSAQAVARVKRLLRSRCQMSENRYQTESLDIRHPTSGIGRAAPKVGHAGTLDPLASGILPLALGEATKTVAFMMDADKVYSFTVIWGEERDTDDIQGAITHTSEKRPTEEEIRAILPKFTGNILQTPPNYSAIKVDGKRAYDMAREGEELSLKAREVRVKILVTSDSWLVTRENMPATSHEPQATTNFLCHCSKGTYIRSLARDMGRELGCFGTVSALRRLKVGKFDETSAISLEKLEEMVHKDGLGFLLPVESALDDILAQDVDANQAAQLKRGQTVILPSRRESTEALPGTKVLARHDGSPVAICELNMPALKPVRVFNL
jgi:tRNA pseudouridine55 synthase